MTEQCSVLLRWQMNIWASIVTPPSLWHNSPLRSRAFSLSRLHDHRHTTLGTTPVDGWPSRSRDLYLTTHNTYKRDIRNHCGIRTHNPRKRAAADLRRATWIGLRTVLTEENQNTREKIHLSATSLGTNPTRPGLALHPGLRSESSATRCQTHGAAVRSFQVTTWRTCL